MELLELAKRVKRGVRLLDKKIPNWRTVHGSYCVLGTLEHYSGLMRTRAVRGVLPVVDRSDAGSAFATAAGRLGLWDDARGDQDAVDPPVYQHGFEAVGGDDEDRKVLDALWRAEFSK